MNENDNEAQSPAWQGGELRCIRRIEETADTATFVLAADSPAHFDFLPGQFITIGVEIGGAKHYRAYSISSSPQENQSVSITVKRVAGGVVSNYLLDGFVVGSLLEALAPAGEFHLPPGTEPGGKVVMLSAGSGITPVMSMVRWLLAEDPQAEIHFIHSARSERDIIFRDELLALAQRHPNFRLDLFLSRPEGGLRCHPGRLTADRLTPLLEEVADSHIYLCGHQNYMDMVEGWHSVRALPEKHFHKESFSPTALPQAESSGQVFVLSVPTFGKEVSIADGQALLDVLEAEGLPIIAACRSGICGSCKCKVVEGEVERISTETLSDEEIGEGIVLACSSRARSSLVVELV